MQTIKCAAVADRNPAMNSRLKEVGVLEWGNIILNQCLLF